MSNYHFRKALLSEKEKIWEILQFAIKRRKEDGSNQWQDGYPNLQVIENDIKKGEGFVLTDENTIIGYSAVIINNEPEYAKIIGKWLTNSDFVVVHRIAIAKNYLGQNLSKILLENVEDFALNNSIYSIKVDTNFDNFAMLKILNKMNYTYCGEVYFRGSPRKAFEKILSKTL
jgi:GNAT superfamily N-acetyltransferase